jgi:Uma2 family endonuclease
MAQRAHLESETEGARPDREDHDNIVVLEGVTWADYERIVAIRGERQFPRLAYLEGILQLMTPSPSHESIKSMIGRLVEAWCFERNVDISPYGAWLIQNAAEKRALEPDECYVLGDVQEIPERPDLAIEVVWTSGGIRKLDIYRGLGVREVWIWKKGTITAYTLTSDGYVEVQASTVLPGIDLEQLCTFVPVKPMTRAVREYRAVLRGTREE